MDEATRIEDLLPTSNHHINQSTTDISQMTVPRTNSDLLEENKALRLQFANASKCLREYQHKLRDHISYATELTRRSELLTKEKDNVVDEILETGDMFPEIPKRGQSGSMFEKYVLRDSIPRTRMSMHSNFRSCECRTSGKTFLVKEYFKRRFDKIERIERVCNEIQTLRAIDHPNVAKILNVYHEAEVVTLLLNATGCSLFERIGNFGAYMSRDERSQFAKTLSSTVSYLHGLNICHMDIRPENVMAESTPTTLRLVDFESRIIYAPNETYQERVGTEDFAAPEILMGESYNPKRADLWSLGYTLLNLEIGHIPFSQNVIPFSRNIMLLDVDDLDRAQQAADLDRTITQFLGLCKKSDEDSPFLSLLAGVLKLDPNSRAIPSDWEDQFS